VSSENTLVLPRNMASLAIGKQVEGYQIVKIIADGTHSYIMGLTDGKILRVNYNGFEYKSDLILFSEYIVESGVVEGHQYVIEEKLFPVPDLSKMIKREQKSYILKQAQAINELHNYGYCHLGIMPENFMQNAEGKIYLVDLSCSDKYNKKASIVKTRKVGYSAPELFDGEVSTAADWYSFGISLCKQFGVDVYCGMSNADIIKHTRSTLVPPTKESLPLWVRNLVHKLVSPDINKRFNYWDVVNYLNTEEVIEGTGCRVFERPLVIGTREIYSLKQLSAFLTENPNTDKRIFSDDDVKKKLEAVGVRYRKNSSDVVNEILQQISPETNVIIDGVVINNTGDILTVLEKNIPEMSPQLKGYIESGDFKSQLVQKTNISQDVLIAIEASTLSKRGTMALYYLLGGKKLVVGNKSYSDAEIDLQLNKNYKSFCKQFNESPYRRLWIEANNIDPNVLQEDYGDEFKALFYLAGSGSQTAQKLLAKVSYESFEYKEFIKIPDSHFDRMGNKRRSEILKSYKSIDVLNASYIKLLMMRKAWREANAAEIKIKKSLTHEFVLSDFAEPAERERALIKLNSIKDEIYRQVVYVARHGNGAVLKKLIENSDINWESSASLKSFLKMVKDIPCESECINLTNVTYENVKELFVGELVTSLPDDIPNKEPDINQVTRYFSNRNVFFVFNEQELQEWVKHRKKDIELRQQRNAHMAKTIMWVVGLAVGIPLFIMALPYLIGIAIAIAIIAVIFSF